MEQAGRIVFGAGRSARKEAAKALAGALFVALCAQIQFPLYPVPVTGQTFGVLLAGGVLGARTGAASMGIYLLLGLAGLPVFAGGNGGASYLWAPSAGYLIGFVFAAALVGDLARRGWGKSISGTVGMMTLGTAVLFIPGLAVLAFHVPMKSLLNAGFFPFLPGAGLKILLASAVFSGLRRFLR